MRKLATFHNKSNIIFTLSHIPSALFWDELFTRKINILQNTLYKSFNVLSYIKPYICIHNHVSIPNVKMHLQLHESRGIRKWKKTSRYLYSIWDVRWLFEQEEQVQNCFFSLDLLNFIPLPYGLTDFFVN